MLFRFISIIVLGLSIHFGATSQCTITSLNYTVSTCSGSNNTFQINGTYTYTGAPATGFVQITANNGSNYNLIQFPPFVNGAVLHPFTITGIQSNGAPLSVTVTFTANPACTLTVWATSPQSCLCTADVGTFTTSNVGLTTTPNVLCYGDAVQITPNNNWVAPGQANSPPNPLGYDPGIGYLVYSCPPTVGVTPAAGVSPGTDPCLIGVAGFGNLIDVNNLYWINTYPPGTFTNNIVYFVPITFYNVSSNPTVQSWQNTTLPCYEMGTPIAVQYLPQITTNQVQNCSAGTVTTTISGSLPQLNGSLFTRVSGSLSPVTATFNNTTCSNGGSIVIGGLANGDNYSYQVQTTNGCIATISGTFNGPPSSAFSYSSANYCVNSPNPTPTITGAAGGTFSASPAGLTLNTSTGQITTATSTPGAYTVTYTTPGSCTSSSTFLVNIRPLPTATISTASATVCQGSSSAVVTFTGAGATAPYTFTYNINGGLNQTVTTTAGNSVNLSVITATPGTFVYNLVSVSSSFSCSQAQAGSATVTVTPSTNAGTLSGNQSICVGGNTTFTSTASGGTWSTSNAGIASVVSGTGVITGVAAGTATITYTVTGSGGCPNATVTRTVTVTTAPTAGTLSGTQTICVGGNTTFTSTLTGGTWSTSNAGIASVISGTGVITGVSAGTATLTYTVAGSGGCPDATVTRTVTVTAAPVAGTLAGNQSICVGGTTTFTSTVSGGSWSSSNTGIATINSSTGVITGVGAGTATITYTMTGSGGCPNATVTRTVTVTAAPTSGTLSGTQTICIGGNTTFTSTVAGGTWSTSDATVATVNSSTGVITGVTAGTATITYTVVGSGGCSNATATRNVTVTAAPNAGTLSGTQAICVGGTTTFTSTVSGGTWSTSSAAIATVNASTGLITGVGAGTATITYTVTGSGGCPNATVTRIVTVTAAPTAGTLTGTQTICVGGNTTFTSTVASGSWSTSNAGVATVNSTTGVITGVSAGTATITYTVAGSGGCSNATATRNVTVTAAPTAGTLSGNQNICVGSTTTFTTTSSGGSFSSSDITIATVNASTGVITGVAAGTATITYTVTGSGGCPNATVTRTVTVTAAPNAGTLSGNQAICVGGTTTFSSTSAGGTWSTSNAGVATVNASTGVVTGVSAGTATITYTASGSGGCSNATATRTVTVTAAPVAGTLSGTQAICVGGTTTFTSTSAGGSFSSSDITIATVNASTGVITGVAAGTATITYTITGSGGCPNVTVTRTVTVTAAPNAGTLSGNQAICVGGTTTFSSTSAGGTWSTSNAGVATVNASTGVVTGVSAGTATITYTATGSGGCSNATATRTVTVTAAPVAGTLSGTQAICVGGTTTFTSTSAGGSFSSSDITIATVNASTGVITGVAAGTATITYTITGSGGCPNVTVTRTVTVTAAPNAGTLSGNQAICVGGTTTFSSTSAGGTWSTSNAGVATVNASTGVVTGVSAGTATITYTATGSGGCSNATATRNVTVTAAPVAGTLSGTQAICVGGTTTFTSTSAGGSFSSSDITIATVNASTGVITGVAAGTATITYTITGSGGCADAIVTRTVTVTAAPNAGTLSGNQAICVGGTTTFSSTSAGGTWSTSNAGVATVNASTGVINGVSAGTATITYTATGSGGCSNATATRTVTVTAAPVAGTLSGTQAICVGGTTTFTSTSAGGAWSSSDATIATIDPVTGDISGIAAGTATITYTVTGSGGCADVTVTRTVTVTAAPNAGTLSGNQAICVGGTTTFSSTSAGGTWSTSNAGVATVNSTTGVINGVSAGTATITYTATGSGGCSNATATLNVTVTAAPVAGTLSGTQAICVSGTTTFTSTSVGGSWSSSDATIATIDPVSGDISGVSAGTATMTYTVAGSGGCGNATVTRTVTVTAAPNAGTLSGTQNICVGDNSTFSSTSAGGSWSSSDITIATIDPLTGDILANAAGTATMTYTVAGSGGCADATATRTVTVNSVPTATISGVGAVCENDTEGIITITGANGIEPYTFTYTINGGVSIPVSSIGNSATIVVTSNVPGSFEYNLIEVSDAGISGCSQTLSEIEIITINANPVPVIGGDADYCAGLTATISTVDTYTDYDWSPANQTTQSIQATIADNPISVTVTDGNGCSGTSAPYNLVENTVIIYDTIISICQGETALIHGNLESVAGIYTQNYPIANGCDSTLNVTLIVNPLPVIDAGVDQTVCENELITLSGSGAPTLVWDGGVVDGVPFTHAPGGQSFTVTGTDANGCVNTDYLEVTINANPVIDPVIDQVHCNGALTTLVTFTSNIAGSTFDWTNSNTAIGLGASGTGDLPSFTATNSTASTITSIITVIPTSSTCPGASTDFEISVLPTPVAAISAPISVCINDPAPTITFTGSQGTAPYTFTYNIDGGANQTETSVGNTATVTAPTNIAGVYTYTITEIVETGVCSATQLVSTTVTVNTLPTVTTGNDTTLCFGDTYDFVANGANTYSWDQGIVDGSSVAPPLGTTFYTVIGTDANGCENTDILTITVNSLPIIDGGLDQIICSGEPVTLTATGGNSFVWTAPVVDGVAFNPIATATYTVTGTGANGCENTDDVIVTVNPIPVISAGQDIAGCDGTQYTLTGSGGGAGAVYVWDNGVTDGVAFNSPIGSTTYTVTGTDANGCENTDQVVVDIQTAPIVSFTFVQNENCVPVSATFTNTSAPIGVNCVWTFGDGTVINNCGTVSNVFDTPGSFDATLQVESTNGCVATQTQLGIINVSPYPVANFDFSPDEVTSLFNEVTFDNQSVGAINYVWSFGDASVTSNLENPVHAYPEDLAGAYQVMLIASNAAGCTDTAYRFINISEELLFYVPNAFTPNNDQFNSTFLPVFTTGFNPQEYTLLIYNRWGEAIFESHNAEIGWNGYYGNGGTPCKEGVYTWKIQFRTSADNDRRTVTGHVNLLK